jgi:hypothetical protein
MRISRTVSDSLAERQRLLQQQTVQTWRGSEISATSRQSHGTVVRASQRN